MSAEPVRPSYLLPPASSLTLFGARAVVTMLLLTGMAVAVVWWAEGSAGLLRPIDEVAYPIFVVMAFVFAALVARARVTANVGLRMLALMAALFLGSFVPVNLLTGQLTKVYDLATLIPWLVVAHLLVFASFSARAALVLSAGMTLCLASGLLQPFPEGEHRSLVRAMLVNGVITQVLLTALLYVVSKQVFHLAFGAQQHLGAFSHAPRTLQQVVEERVAEQDALEQRAQRATEEAREHEREMLAMLQAFPGFVARIDSEGFVTHVNERLATMHRRSIAQAIGSHVSELLGSDGWREIEHRRAQALRTGLPVLFEREFKQPDGSSTWVMGTQFAVPDAQGQPTGACYQLGLDVGELRSAQKALQESLAQIDALFEALPLPTVVKDIEGRFLRVNRAYCELMNCSPSDLIGHPVTEFTHPTNQAGHDTTDRIALETRQVQRYAISRRMADGRVLDMMLHKAAVFTQGGEPLGMVSTLFDVTDINTAARLMSEAREAAESANAAKSAFLATMSHEIRTPMNGVIGMAELLLHEPLGTEQRRSVGTILDSATHLLSLLDDILDFSKVEAGKLTLHEERLTLRTFVQATLSAAMPMAARAKVQLETSFDASVPEDVWADPMRLRQVLNNLLSNAIKFSGDEARRSEGLVGTGVVRVELRAEGQWLIWSVRDNGIGMASHAQQRIFDPFVQADATTTRRFGGTGLGLAISQKLLQLMGGQISVNSEPLKGSLFTARLPMVRAAPTLAEASVSIPALELPMPASAAARPDTARASWGQQPPNGCRVLMVEDDAVNCVVLSRQLELLGYEVTVTHDGHEALQAWRGGGMDLILTDLHMPRMDGYALVRHIRQAEALSASAALGALASPKPRIPILALTANALKGEEAHALRAGMDAYLTKPIRLDALEAALSRWLPTAIARGAAEVSRPEPDGLVADQAVLDA